MNGSLIRQLERRNKKLSDENSQKLQEAAENLAVFVKSKIGSFKDSDIEYLFIGEPKSLKGLLSLCSIMTKFSGDLKKSSLTALKFLLELLDSGESENFGKLFYNIDAENYKILKLHLHIFQSEENKTVALNISKNIKIYRPYLIAEEYINSKSALNEFENWIKTQKLTIEKFEKKKKTDMFKEPKEDLRKQNLEQLIQKYENKHLEGDFMVYQLFFYNILDPE